MTDDIKYRNSTELFLVRGKLVASQQAYKLFGHKETCYEVRYYYCMKCGEVWGKRIDPSHPPTIHRFYPQTCLACGGDEGEMLNGWEWNNLDCLGANALAYVILAKIEANNRSKTV